MAENAQRTPKDRHTICDELVEFVMARMAVRKYKSQIRAELEAALGQEVKVDTYEKICQLARKRIELEACKRPKRFYADSVAFYESVLANEEVPWNVKVRAQENLEVLVGLRERQGAKSPEDHARDIGQVLKGLRNMGMKNPATVGFGADDSESDDSGEDNLEKGTADEYPSIT